jgi:hypothetical protein
MLQFIPPYGNTLFPVWEHFIPNVGITCSLIKYKRLGIIELFPIEGCIFAGK